MEFPLFPVFLRAAVQTSPVPWVWAGLGKSACLPITHLAALEREQSTQTYGVSGFHREKSDQSLFVQHFLRFLSLAYFLWSFSVRNKHMLGFSQMASPLNIIRTVYSALVSCEAQYAGGDDNTQESHFLHVPQVSFTSMFVHLALLYWSTVSKSVSLCAFNHLHRYEDEDVCAKMHFTAIKVKLIHRLFGMKDPRNLQLLMYFKFLDFPLWC